MTTRHSYNRAVCHTLLASVAASPHALEQLGLGLNAMEGQNKLRVSQSQVADALGMTGQPLLAGDVGAAALYLLGFRTGLDGTAALVDGLLAAAGAAIAPRSCCE